MVGERSFWKLNLWQELQFRRKKKENNRNKYKISVATLSCNICADVGLDEFGECLSQFDYDCSPYARRFPASEKIYCRSTRTRNATSSEFCSTYKKV